MGNEKVRLVASEGIRAAYSDVTNYSSLQARTNAPVESSHFLLLCYLCCSIM